MKQMLRRRTRRNTGAAFEDDGAAAGINDFAVDRHRYADLGPEWFTEVVFHSQVFLCWSERNAKTVAEFRLENAATMEQTANHFGKTIPTLRAALKIAKEQFGLDAFGKNVSLPKRKKWPRDNAKAVAEYFQQPGATMKAAVKHFGKSDTTLREARSLAGSDDLQA